jgi:hypothetical protein
MHYYLQSGIEFKNQQMHNFKMVETIPPFCWYILMDCDPTSKACHQHMRLATNMKFAGVNIYGHPNIWCEVQHRLTTKKFFYLELKRNRQCYRPLAEEITICLSAPPMTYGNNYERTFALKLFSVTPHISIQLQIKYRHDKYNWILKYLFNSL